LRTVEGIEGMTKPEVDAWLDPDLTVWISIRCPHCRTVHEQKAAELPFGYVIACSCGAELEIGDDCAAFQQELLKEGR
jgi:hypothetical protein